MTDLFRNYFNWHGRLSKEQYLSTWSGILMIDASLIFLRETLIFLTMSYYSYDKVVAKFMTHLFVTWHAVIFCPVLFATMRRYHDSGKAGWKVILINGLCLVCIVPGFFIGGMTMVAFVFAGAAMVTSGNDFAISGFLGYAAISALLLLAAAGFAILNIKYISWQSDPMENAYGKPQLKS